jgi:hypothetical protein
LNTQEKTLLLLSVESYARILAGASLISRKRL